ncbi:hypothetical protein NQ314_010580 [Rhamnusium bicolor]|uniref:Uncharacterized protein n=1 Tax=Rhamnusium bicolor TaxID=1586634 RepID=A0AAV8XPU8_9CUCU|nr:hypothetical protein NQ314_010580 [Rhamnusium bicolor]
MSNIGFWYIKDAADTFLNTNSLKINKAADTFLNTNSLKISKIVAIRIEKNNPSAIKSMEVYSEMLPWVQSDVLKKGNYIVKKGRKQKN